MIIRRKIYWHAAVIATEDGDYDPEIPIAEQKAASTLQNVATESIDEYEWLRTSASSFIYGVKNCNKISISLAVDESGQVIDRSGGVTTGLRANNADVAPGEIRFILPPSVLLELLGDPIEVKNVTEFINLPKKPIRYRLFAVYRSGPGISCDDNSTPDSYFSSENIPDEVVPSNDGVSRAAFASAMGPISDLDANGQETGFYVKMKQHDPIERIGCCDIVVGGETSSSSSSSSISIAECPTTAVAGFSSTASEYRIWMVRQNIQNKYDCDPGVSELVYADISSAIDTLTGDISPSAIRWHHAGFINFEDAYAKSYSGLANMVSYANESGNRSQMRLLAPEMFDISKNMAVNVQHIAWDNRGFLWALCSGGFKMQTSDIESGNFITTEGVYRLIPGGWYNLSSKIYSWGGGNHGQKTAASLIDGLNASILKVAAGFVENNATPYCSFSIILDSEGFIHVRNEGTSSIGGSVISYPDFNASGERFAEIDAGNGIVCAITNAGKLMAWNLANPNHSFYTQYQEAVDDANASTQQYLHCAVSLENPNGGGFVIASRSDGRTVDSFPVGDTTGLAAKVQAELPAGSVINKVIAGRFFAAVKYTDSNGHGKIMSSGQMGGLLSSALVDAAIVGKDVLEADAGGDFIAICARDQGSTELPLLATITPTISSTVSFPDDLRISFADGIQASNVYCGLNRIISSSSEDLISTFGADDYAYALVNSSTTPEGGLGRSVATGIHARDGVGGVRKYAVMVAGNTGDINNGSVSIFVKFLTDVVIAPASPARPDGEWKFLAKVFADQFTSLLPSGQDMSSSEFGYSVSIANNNDIIIGAPGKGKVCILRKTGASVTYNVHAVISAPADIPSVNRFGHVVQWMPLKTQHGVIAVGAPVADGNPTATGGAVVMSEYSSTGTVNAVTTSFFADDFITGTFTGGKFGTSIDYAIPSVPIGGVLDATRYNMAITDPFHKFVLQINAKYTSSTIMEIVGSVDKIELAGSNDKFATQVKYSHRSAAAADRQTQLLIAWAQDAVINLSGRQGIVWAIDSDINESDGTLHYSFLNSNQQLGIGTFPTSSGLIFGSKIDASGGVVVVQGSIPVTPNVSHRNAYFIYKMSEQKLSDLPPGSAEGSPSPSNAIWELVEVFNDQNVSGVIYPGCSVLFARNIHGHEVLIGSPARFQPSGHTKQGKIFVLPQNDYPIGIGRRLHDIPDAVKNTPISCAAIGRKHQILAAKGDNYYDIPSYSDARLCTASRINNNGAVFDQSLTIAVPKLDPITRVPVNPSIYHFGSMAAFVVDSNTVLSNYDTTILPIYSDGAKTIRVAEMHWKPFKVLDRPIDYENLTFTGTGLFKVLCDGTGNPIPNAIPGQSGAFSTPRLEEDGVADADIDSQLIARNFISSAQVYYIPGTESNAGRYVSSAVGSVSNNVSINPISNPNNPLDPIVANIEFVPLHAFSIYKNVFYPAYLSEGSSTLCQTALLNPVIWAYYGTWFNVQANTAAGAFTDTYGFRLLSPLVYPNNTLNWRNLNGTTVDPPGTPGDTDSNPLPDNLRYGRKVFWNTLSANKNSSIIGRIKLVNADIALSILQPSYANNLSFAAYDTLNWHKSLSHMTDTVQNVRVLQRQSVEDPDNNPLTNSIVYSGVTNSLGWPTGRFRPQVCNNSNYNVFNSFNDIHQPWSTQDPITTPLIVGARHVPLEIGDIYKQHIMASSNTNAYIRFAFQDFLGRGAGILVSHRGTRVCWNPIAWPVLRNQLSLLPGLISQYDYYLDAAERLTDRSTGIEPGWSNADRNIGITTDQECIIGGISTFPAPSSSFTASYGIVSGRVSVIDGSTSVNTSNSQIGYLYSLKGVDQPNNTRVPVDFDDGSFVVPPALHAIGCAGLYIDTGVPDQNELVILSSATFSCGSTSSDGPAISARQHLWLQKRKCNGASFPTTAALENVATTLPNPTVNELKTKGLLLANNHCSFRKIVGCPYVCGSNTLLKTVQNHTDINVWNVAGDNLSGIAIIAIGGRALAMRTNVNGLSALTTFISENTIAAQMSTVVSNTIRTGSYYNLWIAAFDNTLVSPPEKFGRTISRFVDSFDIEMAVSLGGGIAFKINNEAHVWYAGYIYKITHNLGVNSIGPAIVTDVTSTVYGTLNDEISKIGPGSSFAGDFIQGFVSGYANDGWFIISNTRENTDVLYVFKIDGGQLTLDSSLSRTDLDFETNEFINLPFKLAITIDSTGTSLSVGGHKFATETDTEDNFSTQYITGYDNADLIQVFARTDAGGSPWILSGSLTSSSVTETQDAPISSFVETSMIHETGTFKYLVAISGSDLSFSSEIYPFYEATNATLRSKPGKMHTFELNPTAAPSAVGECNDLLAVSNASFVGSTYSNLNFWCSVPMTAHNGTQSMAYSSADNVMYFSTLGYIGAMQSSGEGSWDLKRMSSTSHAFAQVSAFKYPFPASSCTICATQSQSDFGMYKPPRIGSGIVSGNMSGGKRALAFRPSSTPSLIAIDDAPNSVAPDTPASAGITDVIDSYASIDSAPYMHKLNSTPRALEWDVLNGYKLSYSPSSRSFVKRYELESSPQFGNGLTLVSGSTFSPIYAASFANCPPVWDAEAGMWSWGGIKPIRLSSSHTYSRNGSPNGPLMQMSWSDVFGLACFSFNTSNIYAFRETVRSNVSHTDDLSDDNINEMKSFRETTVVESGTDSSTRGGQIIRINSPASLNGTITSSNIVNNFNSTGIGSRFMIDGPGSVVVAATNASANAKDVTHVCKSGIPLFARDRSSSSLGPVLLLIDDSTIMGNTLPESANYYISAYDSIPDEEDISLPYGMSDDAYPQFYSRTSGSGHTKYAVDNNASLFERSKMKRTMRAISRMLDPVYGDLFLGDEILIACSSALNPTSPSSQIYPSAVSGISSPFKCVCQSELIRASMRIDTWNARSTTDIFSKIFDFSANIRGGIFSTISPPSIVNKFAHVVIFCSDISLPASVDPQSFAQKIMQELTAVGNAGLLRSDGSIHVVDLNPSVQMDFKKELGGYGTYCAWRGGGS